MFNILFIMSVIRNDVIYRYMRLLAEVFPQRGFSRPGCAEAV